MAIRVAVHRVCDRCQHPFDESLVKYGTELPKFPKKSIAAVLHEEDKNLDTVLFQYEDLCQDCERVVDGYIKRIRMDEGADDAPTKKKPGRKASEKSSELTGAVATETSAKEARFEPVEIPGAVSPSVPEVAATAISSSTELPAAVNPTDKQVDNTHPF
jgi:hypothetical protein